MTKVAKEAITPESFAMWVEGMKNLGVINSDADAARLLDVNRNTITVFRRRGVDRKTWLACLYLLQNRGLPGGTFESANPPPVGNRFSSSEGE